METKNLLNKKITQWLLLVAMLVGCSASAWAHGLYITCKQSGHYLNVHKWTSCDTSWPGDQLSTNTTKLDAGGFYSTTCGNNFNWIINNNKSNQTGDYWQTKDLWVIYDKDNSSYNVVMDGDNKTSSGKCQFASPGINGGSDWSTKVSATWDSSKSQFKYTCSSWKGASGVDIYLGGNKFLYKSCDKSSAGNYTIYWNPFNGTLTFESNCTTPTQYTVSGNATICSGTTTTVTLANSQTNYKYKLYKGGSEVSSSEKSGTTGQQLTWTVSEAGTYTVTGYMSSNTSCSQQMSGSAVISTKGATITNVTPAEAHPYEIVTLTASKSATWSITGTPSVVADDEYYPVSVNTGKTFSFKGAKGTSGNYTVRASADDCDTDTTISIVNDPNKCN